MIKLRLTGTLDELAGMIGILEENAAILTRTNPVKNRNSSFYRVYLTVEKGGYFPCVK